MELSLSFQGTTLLGTATLIAGQGALTSSSLAAGSWPIKAIYGGDSGFAAITSPVLTQTVLKQALTVTSIRSTPNPSVAGQMVTFTAVVSVDPSGRGSPTGTVSFNSDDTVIGTGTVDDRGLATFSTSTLKPGKYNLKAVYNGSPALVGSTSPPLSQVVQ